MPSRCPAPSQLAVVGTAAGAFSGLFGVGGGVVIVPLLILWLGYGEREATGDVARRDRRDRRRGGRAPGRLRQRRRRRRACSSASRRSAAWSPAPRCSSGSRRAAIAGGFALFLVASAIVLLRVTDVVGVIAIGFVAGLAAGLLGIGGGVLFVPALVALPRAHPARGAGDVAAGDHAGRASSARRASTATATCACATACRSACSPAGGALAGVALANALPERALEVSFAMLSCRRVPARAARARHEEETA